MHDQFLISSFIFFSFARLAGLHRWISVILFELYVWVCHILMSITYAWFMSNPTETESLFNKLFPFGTHNSIEDWTKRKTLRSPCVDTIKICIFKSRLSVKSLHFQQNEKKSLQKCFNFPHVFCSWSSIYSLTGAKWMNYRFYFNYNQLNKISAILLSFTHMFWSFIHIIVK